MIDTECIFPECFADTFFVKLVLGLNNERLNHKHGKTPVLSALDKLDIQKALAIIDKDPRAKVKIDLTSYNYELEDSDEDNFLKLYKHVDKDYRIIEINEEFEFWISKKLIPETGIDPTNHGIPPDWEKSDYLKDEYVRKKKGVYPFFQALINSNSPSINKFKDWVITHTK